MPTFDVTSFGESMLRLSAPQGTRLVKTRELTAHIGGAESNALTALAALGRRTAWHSRLPDNPLGRMVLQELRAAGVDTSSVTLEADGRLGLYFFEPPSGPLPGSVVYDRAGSSFARIGPQHVEWSALLDTTVLHLTGITPALGPGCQRLTLEALERARAAGVSVSFDVNYRRKLWPPARAFEALAPLVREVDLLICGISDARNVLGLEGGPGDVLEGLARMRDGRDVVLTCGPDGALALASGRLLRAEATMTQVVDELGAGDAFAAGVIDGWLEGSLEAGLRRGAMLAAVKLGQHGDTVCLTREELESRLAGANPERVQR